MCACPASPLAVVCSFERKGCGSTVGQQELAVACACVSASPVVLVLIQVWQWLSAAV
jgi:hypothetical protein